MLRNLNMEIFYAYPPERVWQVLTNRQALAAWLMENDFEPRVGHKFQFQQRQFAGGINPLQTVSLGEKTSSTPGLSGSIDCQVIELDEPRKLSYTWQDSMMCQPSIVTWTLEPVNGGTRLQLEHKGFQYEVIKVGEPMRLFPQWQSHLRHQPNAVSRTLETVTKSTHLQPVSTGFEALDSIILSSFLSGGWNHLLKNKLQQALAHIAVD
ncbi:MAG: SRPBCC domain-containing protein [Nodularia sp. CChRGM 3473]